MTTLPFQAIHNVLNTDGFYPQTEVYSLIRLESSGDIVKFVGIDARQCFYAYLEIVRRFGNGGYEIFAEQQITKFNALPKDKNIFDDNFAAFYSIKKSILIIKG